MYNCIFKIYHKVQLEKIMPDSWNEAVIILLQKKSNETECSNYRISLLNSIYSILQSNIKLVVTGPMRHQRWIRTIAVLHRTDSSSIRINSPVLMTVQLRQWKRCRQRFNTPLHLVKLIKSFLNSRCFTVKIEDTTSNIRPILVGIPQSSCLSPFFYLVYANG